MGAVVNGLSEGPCPGNLPGLLPVCGSGPGQPESPLLTTQMFFCQYYVPSLPATPGLLWGHEQPGWEQGPPELLCSEDASGAVRLPEPRAALLLHGRQGHRAWEAAAQVTLGRGEGFQTSRLCCLYIFPSLFFTEKLRA